jgi:galactosamine-6-phosphate isomerase
MPVSPPALHPTAPAPADVARPGWDWHIHADEAAMSEAAAARLAVELRARRNALVCLATGSTPTPTYERLIAWAQSEPDRFAQVRWLKLDEWGGLAMDDPASCEHYLRRLILTPLSVPPERYFGWESQPADTEAECRRVAAWLETNGPIDLQVLGLGENGHLGFNEPAAQLQSGPHVAQLSPASLGHSMLGPSRGRVAYGLTLGMDDILNARHIMLLVTGERKASQLRRLLCGEISAEFPASLLRRHRAVSVYCDTAAAALLPPAKLAPVTPPEVPAP